MTTVNKRIELHEFEEPLVLKEVPLPEAPPEGAVIKIHYSGICHSDTHVIKGDTQSGEAKEKFRSLFKRPVLLGHEISVEVFKFGSAVNTETCGFQLGDLVMVFPWPGCEVCGYCKAGESNLCFASMLHSYGMCLDSGRFWYQQYVPVYSLSHVRQVPGTVPMDTAAIIPCSGLTAYSAVMRTLPIIEKLCKYFETIGMLIVGAGGLGLWGIQFAKALMPENTKIYVAEMAESKFETAIYAGADRAILWDPKATTEEKVAATKAIIPQGFQAVVDFVGSESTGQTTVCCVAKGATIVSVGLFKGTYSIDSNMFPFQMLNITGSLNGTKTEMTTVIDLVASGKVTGPPLYHVTLEEVNDVLDGLQAGTRRGRSVIRFV